MSYFTFETAYLVAHMQNDANEALKERIRERLTDLCGRMTDLDAIDNFADFEQTCQLLALHGPDYERVLREIEESRDYDSGAWEMWRS